MGRGGSHYTTNPLKELIKNEEEVKRINEVVLPAIFLEIEKCFITEEQKEKLKSLRDKENELEEKAKELKEEINEINEAKQETRKEIAKV